MKGDTVKLAGLFAELTGDSGNVRFSAYDGSAAGPPDAAVHVVIRDGVAVTHVAQAPGSLGMARAYIGGHLDVDGDIYLALRDLSNVGISDMGWRKRLQLFLDIGPLALRRVPPPPQEIRLRGRLHSERRDAEAIAHHYDVSNRFYELFLGESMAYTCAVYPREDATLTEAQYEKFDLVARKLGLRPGMRLLDVGCGWGGMVIHAARHYGVKALGVTLSHRQAEWAAKAISEAGLTELAEVRHLDYRHVPESGFDAVSSIGLTEHIGRDQLPAYFGFLYSRLRPGGRLLNHCITHPRTIGEALVRRGFINRYVFPDGELSSAGALATQLHDAGFELRHAENLREHYAKTCAAWVAGLEANWPEAVAEVGEARARVWRLYMAGSRLGFERNEIELHQLLGVRLDGTDAHMPLRPDWGS